MQDLSAIRLQLSTHTNTIALFLNLFSIGSQGNVERMSTQGGELRKIRDDVNWIAATLQARSKREGSILTSYTNDDKSFWKELRRELFKKGCSSKVLKRHKTTIKNYCMYSNLAPQGRWMSCLTMSLNLAPKSLLEQRSLLKQWSLLQNPLLLNQKSSRMKHRWRGCCQTDS